MRIIEKIRKERDLYINPEDLERIAKRKIIAYRIQEIPVGKIRRYLDGKIFSLYYTDAYKLLNNPTSKELQKKYDKYCEDYCYKYENRSKERFKNLVDSIDIENYDPKKGIIIVDQLFIIADGQHRSCVLLKKFGPNHKVKVLRVFFADMGIKTYIRNFIYEIDKVFKKQKNRN